MPWRMPPGRSASGSGPGVRVTGFELSARREITAVLTDAGPIDDGARRQRRRDVGAAGRGDGRRRSSRRPRSTTSTSRSRPCPGSELPRDMPCFRDPDNLVYGKSEHGGMVFGGYELGPALALGGRRALGARRAVAAARLGALRAADGRRDPALPVPRRRRGDPPGLPPGRDDARREPAARAAPGRARLLGRGRAVAQRVRRRRRDRAGDGGLDHGRRPGRGHRAVPGVAVRRRRIAIRGSRPAWPARRTRDYYRLRYPYDADWPGGRGASRRSTGGSRRPARCSARRPAGSGPTTTTRPAAWRRAGRDQAGYGWTRPPWFERVVAEARAVRERAGIIDLSSFGKIEVEGPGALGLLQRVSANDIDRPVGQRRLHAVVRRARRDRRRRDGHAARRRSVPGRDRRGLSSRPSWPGSGRTRR